MIVRSATITAPNQVDPYGDLHRSPGRRTATWTGNNDYPPARIICDMDLKWRKENRRYLRLFFLDEATALAAGYRPCNTCRRAARNAFCEAWGAATGTAKVKLDVINRQLGEERGQRPAAPADLPVGTMIDVDGTPFLVGSYGIHPWSWDGYGPVQKRPDGATVITPPSTVAVLRSGYPLTPHPSTEA